MVDGLTSEMAPRSARRLAMLGSLFVVAIGLLSVIAYVGFIRDSPMSCDDWLAADTAKIEAVPVSAFVGRNIGHQTATCDQSQPKTLFIEVSVPAGATMPSGWFQRDRVGPWTAKYRLNATYIGDMICYTSSDATSDGVELRVWASGMASASITKGRVPCKPPQT